MLPETECSEVRILSGRQCVVAWRRSELSVVIRKEWICRDQLEMMMVPEVGIVPREIKKRIDPEILKRPRRKDITIGH